MYCSTGIRTLATLLSLLAVLTPTGAQPPAPAGGYSVNGPDSQPASTILPTVPWTDGVEKRISVFPPEHRESIDTEPQSVSSRGPALPPVILKGTESVGQSWSFSFKDAPWPVVIRNLSGQFGFSVDFVETPTSTFTYFDSNTYSVDRALDVLNDHLLKEGFIIVRNERNLTVIGASGEIPDSSVPFVGIHDLDRLGRNELASVAFPIRHADPVQAVQEISQLLSPLGHVKALSDSRRVIITDTGTYLRRLGDLLLERGVGGSIIESVVYQLHHASAEDVASSINQFLTGQSGQQVSGGPRTVVGAGGNRVVAEPTTNSLLIRGTGEEISGITAIIQDLDRGPREVLVQAVLVEVQLGNTHEHGVEVGFQDSVLFDRSVIDNLVTITETTTNPLGSATTNQRIISQTSAPGFNFNNPSLGNNTAIRPSTIGGQGLSSFGLGRVNGDLGFGGLVLSAGSESVNVLLRSLDANFDIDILSRPQIRTVENHEATIQIGQQVPVVDGVSVTAVGSANPVIRQEEAGIILRVIPRISPSGRIAVDVNAEKSAFRLAPGTGVPIFTDATNGNVIEAPVKDITTANTTVSVQSGQTIVLGGMITNENRTVNRKVPWLGDLPVVGRAFRYDLNEMARTELLVLLTPIQITDDMHADSLLHQEVSRVHMPASAWEFNDNVFGTAPYRTVSAAPQSVAPFPTAWPQEIAASPADGSKSPSAGGHSAGAMSTAANASRITPVGFQQTQPRTAIPGRRQQTTPRSWRRRANYRGHYSGQLLPAAGE